jgi:hypothetical protein
LHSRRKRPERFGCRVVRQLQSDRQAMRNRRDDDDTLPPKPRDDRRLRLRREMLRDLQITELKVVVGGARRCVATVLD